MLRDLFADLEVKFIVKRLLVRVVIGYHSKHGLPDFLGVVQRRCDMGSLLYFLYTLRWVTGEQEVNEDCNILPALCPDRIDFGYSRCNSLLELLLDRGLKFFRLS